MTALDFDTTPDYDKLRNILKSGLKIAKGNMTSPLKFKTSSPMKRKNSELGATEVKEKKKKSTKKLEYNNVDQNLKKEKSSETSEVNVTVKKTKVTKKKSSEEATKENHVATTSVVSNRPKRNVKAVDYNEK